MNRKNITFSALLLGIAITVQGQQAATATGGNASGSGGTATYSVGQIVYTTNAGAAGSVSQGAQQAYKIFTVLGVEDPNISLNMQAYPNPTPDYLTLNVGASTALSNQTLTYELFDLNGKLIENKKIKSNTETIRMETLPGATYFLKVRSNNKEVKSFKIIKN